MKLFATLETSKGKVVSVSDNEQITATVYDGNMKAYSVIIEWTLDGNPEHYECLECGALVDNIDNCSECGNNADNSFLTIPAEMGAIVTTREWRNQPNERRKAQRTA